MKTFLLIDGENFKNKIKAALKDAGKNKLVWHEYNFKGLLEKVLQGIEINEIIFYFAKIKEDPQTREKSKQLIENQRLLKTHLEKQGFRVILAGRVRGYIENNRISENQILVFKEKGVDVKIAVDMVSWACDKKVEQIILGSSDSDLQPAIKEIREREVNCIYLGFENQPNKGIMFTTNRTILIRNFEIIEFEK